MNHKGALYVAVAGMCILGGTGCTNRPKGVLSDKEAASVVADLELAEAYMKATPGSSDAMRRRLADAVIAKHGLTRADFDSTMSWYGRNLDEYSEMADLAAKELQKRQKKSTGKTEEEEDLQDLWTGPRRGLISGLSGKNSYEFTTEAGSVTPGSRLRLRMRLDKGQEGWIMLGVRYDNGLYGYMNRSLVSSDRKIDLTLQTDTAYRIEEAFGHIIFTTPRRSTLGIDSIYLNVLPFDSTQYYIIHGQKLWKGATP